MNVWAAVKAKVEALKGGRLQHYGTLVAIVVVSFGFVYFQMRDLPFLAMVENWAGDFRTATQPPPQPIDPDIVIVGLTDQTLEKFPYRSPVDRAFLADLLTQVQQRGAKAVGLDILFDQPSEPAKDDAVRAVINNYPIPLIISYATQEDGLTPNQIKVINSFNPPDKRSFANLVKDPYDSTVRWIYPGRCVDTETSKQVFPPVGVTAKDFLAQCAKDGHFVPGFANNLAKKLGIPLPSDLTVEVPLVWRTPPAPGQPSFRVIPAHLLKLMPPAWIKDKIVLIGADVSLGDRHRTPYSAYTKGEQGLMAGVQVHANGLAQLIHGQKLITAQDWQVNLMVLFFAALGLLIAMLDRGLTTKLIILAVILIALWIGGFVLVREQIVMIPLVGPSLALATSLAVGNFYVTSSERKQKKFIRGAMSRYVSPAYVEQLVENPELLSLASERREMSFIFTDIAGFTTFAETTEPQVMADTLNTYLDGVCDVIFERGGTIANFIGDAVYVIFSAPVHQDDHARRAVETAFAIDTFSEEYRKKVNEAGVPLGHTRIGVHTATALVGNFGGEHQQYTAMGDAVNTAARLEGLNKYVGTRVMLSQATAEKSNRPYRPLGDIVLKGKTEPLTVAEPVTEEWLASSYGQRYMAAYAMMSAGDAGTMDALKALLEENPKDPPVKFHLKRLADADEISTLVVMDDK